MDKKSSKSQQKNYITGTTRGLGKALLSCFASKVPFEDFVGLNRPRFDLEKNLEMFIKNDFGIYILNAHHKWSQIEILYKLFEANKHRDCQIVVIGSVSADGDRKQVNRYAIEKKALDAACTQLQLLPSACFITQIKLGRVNTEMVKDKMGPKMSTKDVSELVHKVLLMKSQSHYVKSITIDNKIAL